MKATGGIKSAPEELRRLSADCADRDGATEEKLLVGEQAAAEAATAAGGSILLEAGGTVSIAYASWFEASMASTNRLGEFT